MVNLASSIANCAVEHSSLVVLSRFLKPLEPKKTVGLKLLISPANLHLNPFVSNLLIGLIPDRPSFKAVQNCSFPIPFGAITPMPVITIRFLVISKLYSNGCHFPVCPPYQVRGRLQIQFSGFPDQACPLDSPVEPGND